MSWVRWVGLVAWLVIHVLAFVAGVSLTGERHNAGRPHSTHGASGPTWACRRSRITPPAGALVALNMPRSPVLSRDGV
jgi:hypothetical protein